MRPFFENTKKLVKKGEYVSASGSVLSGRGMLKTITAIGTGTAGYVEARDGAVDGPVLYRIGTPAQEGESVPIELDIPFDTGLYIVLSNASASVSYQYMQQV